MHKQLTAPCPRRGRATGHRPAHNRRLRCPCTPWDSPYRAFKLRERMEVPPHMRG